MEKINFESQGLQNESGEPKEGMFKKLVNRLTTLKTLGVAIGALLIMTEKAQSQTNNMTEKSISADSMLYKMAESQKVTIYQLTHEVDNLMHQLQSEFKKTVSKETQANFMDSMMTDMHSEYDKGNVSTSMEDGIVVDYKGDTIKTSEDWIVLSDQPFGDHGIEHKDSKETVSFQDYGEGAYEVDVYTNDRSKEYGEELVTFEYGNSIQETDAIMVQHFSQEADRPNHTELFTGGSADNGYKKLEKALKDIKVKIKKALEEKN